MKTSDMLKALLWGAAGAFLAKRLVDSSNPEPDWKGLSVRNVTNELESCMAPSYWWPEMNYKKMCQLDGEQHYLKAATSRSLKEAFGREFAKKNLEVKAPDTSLLYEANGVVRNYFGIPIKREYYIASKAIATFRTAVNLIPSKLVFFNQNNENYCAEFRDNLVNNIGEQGIEKFAVARTFYNDLHLRNWGYDEQGIVLIDVDTMPDNISGFFESAIGNLNRLKILGLELSLNNIINMRLNYKTMQQKPIPKIHESVDMSNEMYLTLTTAYIEACEYAIQRIKSEILDLNYSEPSAKINDILVDGFKEVSLNYDNDYFRYISYFF